MKKIVVSVFVLCLFGVLPAQPPQYLSLEDAFQKALASRAELQAQAVQVQIAATANDKVRAQWMPSVSATADLRWNTQLQSNVLPIGAFGLPGVAPDATRTVEFGAPFNNTLSLQAGQKILHAESRIDRKINANEVDKQRNELRRLEARVRFDVTAAYYNVLWQQERVKLAFQTVNCTQVVLTEGSVRFQNGVLLQNDLDRLILDQNNAQFALNKAESDLKLAWKNLNYQLQVPDNTMWVLSTQLEQLRQGSAAALPTPRIAERPEIQAENLAAHGNGLQRQKELARRLPSIDAYANYTLLQLHDQPNPFASGTWYPFNYIGIRATVPIYDGKQAKLAARDYALRSEINALNAQQLEADFAYETEQYRSGVEQTELELEQARQNLALAKRVYDTDAFRLSQGVIQIRDLRDSEYARQQADNNYLQAVYNWLKADLNYKKASGNW